jgi:hypothetical protein
MRTRSIAALAILGWLGCDEGVDAPREVVSGKFRDGVGDAHVRWTGSAGLNVRALPSKASERVDWLAEGAATTVDCQTVGDWVGNSNVWDYVGDKGGYVADAYVDSGYASWIPGVPECGAPDEGCGDVDYAGYCDGTTLVWCEDDALHEVDCALTAQSCGYRDASIGFDCLSGGGGDDGDGRLTIEEIVGGVDFWVGQDYGPTTFDGGYGYCHAYGNWSGLVHCGIDISIPNGTPLFVPEDSTAIIVGSPYFEDWNDPNAANTGELRLETPDGTHIILGHMSRIDLWEGQDVEMGDWSGLSGYANGDHVHIEVRVRDDGFASGYRTVDPAEYFGL